MWQFCIASRFIRLSFSFFFFFNDTATTEIYTLSLHDALPIWRRGPAAGRRLEDGRVHQRRDRRAAGLLDRKSTRLNSSHVRISYAVFCLKKKKKNRQNDMCKKSNKNYKVKII